MKLMQAGPKCRQKIKLPPLREAVVDTADGAPVSDPARIGLARKRAGSENRAPHPPRVGQCQHTPFACLGTAGMA